MQLSVAKDESPPLMVHLAVLPPFRYLHGNGILHRDIKPEAPDPLPPSCPFLVAFSPLAFLLQPSSSQICSLRLFSSATCSTFYCSCVPYFLSDAISPSYRSSSHRLSPFSPIPTVRFPITKPSRHRRIWSTSSDHRGQGKLFSRRPRYVALYLRGWHLHLCAVGARIFTAGAPIFLFRPFPPRGPDDLLVSS